MIIDTASVKVMRSYDYCHFEVCLSSSLQPFETSVQVDALRKEAARLADKAVEQYKIAKENAERAVQDDRHFERLRDTVAEIRNKPESEWTEKEKAFVKVMQDFTFHSRHRYNYQEEWDEDSCDTDWPDDPDDRLF